MSGGYLGRRKRSEACPEIVTEKVDFSPLVPMSFRGHSFAVKDSMRFVVAGLGWWGRSWTDVLKIHPKAKLIATVDPSTDARDWSRRHLGVAHFPDLDNA